MGLISFCPLLQPVTNKIVFSFCFLFFRSLSNCPSQASFNLSGNQGINGKFLEELLMNLTSSCSSPLSFNLSSCGICSPLRENIFQVLQHSTIPLVELDLSFCDLKSEEVSRLSAAWQCGGNRRVASIEGPLCELSTSQQYCVLK